MEIWQATLWLTPVHVDSAVIHSIDGLTSCSWWCHSYWCSQVLDEIFHVLTYIKNNPSPPRAHELLQELRDISSMAMEHFDEKIVPVLKRQMPSVQHSLNTSFPGLSSSSSFATGIFIIIITCLSNSGQMFALFAPPPSVSSQECMSTCINTVPFIHCLVYSSHCAGHSGCAATGPAKVFTSSKARLTASPPHPAQHTLRTVQSQERLGRDQGESCWPETKGSWKWQETIGAASDHPWTEP